MRARRVRRVGQRLTRRDVEITHRVGAGIAVGLIGAYVLARGLRTLLFGIEWFDPAVFVGVAVFLAVAAMASSLTPAMRAARVDANVLLRNGGQSLW